MVFSFRDDHIFGYFKRFKDIFTYGSDIKFYTVTTFKTPVDGSGKYTIRLPWPIYIPDIGSEELVEHLSYQWPFWSGGVGRAQSHKVNSSPGHKTKRRIKLFTDTGIYQCSIPFVIGVINLKAKSRSLIG